MPISELFSDVSWDAPFFKRLAHNDTGRAPGHQGGIVIPKDLRAFFPSVSTEDISSDHPTTDRHIHAELWISERQVDDVVTRYQYQTWGGIRSAESRITSNLSRLRNIASADDFLIFQRHLENLDLYRVILVKSSDPDYKSIALRPGNERWGLLNPDKIPLKQADIKAANQDINNILESPFELKVKNPASVTATTTKIARSQVFRKILLEQYSYRCCISGISLFTPNGIHEAQAAHVVPLGNGGSDDPRNDIILTGTIHWAFDRGLISLNTNRRTVVSPLAPGNPHNQFLKQYSDIALSEAKYEHYRVEQSALDWHHKNIFIR